MSRDNFTPGTWNLVSNALSGASAGVIAATFVCPLDVIKTRFQVLGVANYNGPGRLKGSIIVRSLDEIVKKEGFRGLYRGLSPTILALLPNWAVYFTVYEQLKSLLSSKDGIQQNTIGANILAAAGAGAATTIATNPLWVVKTRFQIQGVKNDGVVPYTGTFNALKRIRNEEGFKGFYRGLVPALVGVSHVAIQFPTYEKIKLYLAEKDNRTVDSLPASDVAIASSVSKIIASTLTYPHEVVRSRLQVQGKGTENKYKGVTDCVKKIYRTEGIKGFYNGCGTNLLRTTPAAVITFTSFEMIHRFIFSLKTPTDTQPQII